MAIIVSMNRPEHRSNFISGMGIITGRTTRSVIIGITMAVTIAMTDIIAVKLPAHEI